MHASEIAKTVNRRVSLVESEASGYQLRRSPFVQRQMAKGKRYDRLRTSAAIKDSGEAYTPVPESTAVDNQKIDIDFLAPPRRMTTYGND